VVVPDRPQSVKALCALVTGRWVVTPAYLQESARLGFWAHEDSVAGSMRYANYPFRQEHVMLQLPDGPIRDALRLTVEYGEGIVVENNAANRRRANYIVVTSGSDIVNLCKERDGSAQ
jgi:hypothetical protein